MINITMWEVWIILSLILFIIEIFHPVFFFAALGLASIISFVSSFFFAKEIQLLIFSISSLIVFFAVRPKILKYIYISNDIKTNIDAMIGKRGVVIETIHKNSKGRVKIGDETWIAISQDNKEIKKGEIVTINDISGTKIYVTKLEE